MGQPDAIAGAILWDVRLSGKLNGDIPETRPTGKYLINPSLPSPAGVQSSWRYSDGSRLDSSAAILYICIALSTSTKAYFIGFAASWARSLASSLRFAVNPLAMLFSILLFLCEGMLAISFSIFWASAMASSSSCFPAREQ